MRFKKTTFWVQKVHFRGSRTSPNLILATGLSSNDISFLQNYSFEHAFFNYFMLYSFLFSGGDGSASPHTTPLKQKLAKQRNKMAAAHQKLKPLDWYVF